jgi:hypothetical protein
MVSVHEQKLKARAAEQGAGGAEETAPFRLARQVVGGTTPCGAALDGNVLND